MFLELIALILEFIPVWINHPLVLIFFCDWCFYGTIEVLSVLLLPIEIYLSVMEIWYQTYCLMILADLIWDDISKSVAPDAFKWCIWLYFFVVVQNENVEVLITDIIFWKVLRTTLFDKVIPDFDNVITIIDMPINEGVQSWFKTTYELFVCDDFLVDDPAFIDVEDLE